MTDTPEVADRLDGRAAVPIASYDAIVCDLDGVVYRGDGEVPGAPTALQDMAARGVRVLYATNNASRVPSEVAEHLRRLGAPARNADVVTSAEAGAAITAEHVAAGSPVLALGGEGVAWALTRAGLEPVAPSEAASRGATAVLQGLGRQLTVADFEVAARLIEEGAVWVVTNGDTTLPLQWGTAPGNGAYVDLLRTATGQEPVAVAGKPQSPLYELAVDRLGTAPQRTLAVGDRLDTDIAGARAAGLDSAWVLTGVDRPSALLDTDLDPTFVIASLSELLQPYAVPSPHEGTWRCASATASLEDGVLTIERGDAEPIEAMRAGLAALIELRDRRADGDASDRAGDEAASSATSALQAGGAVLDDLMDAAAGG
ncbi:HAD superfamily hydrolase (TIGR01450 family) [Humibacillus xanthopallidus]|uniref:HAD superfamily hydrolase (TIGR01450 family) n=1 Tax=Humibacillus xanthopallidus TaxID=412689 RepID=A0A543PVW4_9MICO|nr:HAD-IIA family hydrolase [Humibacillus xanthopallidus]TQN48223.1 HAD superfamily hydrolase (TIGR01450 family) [Humibacillus xanthopallidus]